MSPLPHMLVDIVRLKDVATAQLNQLVALLLSVPTAYVASLQDRIQFPGATSCTHIRTYLATNTHTCMPTQLYAFIAWLIAEFISTIAGVHSYVKNSVGISNQPVGL